MTQPSVDDATLVRRALGGDRWAEDALYRRHAPGITSAVSRLLGRSAEADDVVQDAFVRALERLPQLREEAAFGRWIASIAMNLARQRLRRRKLLRMVPWSREGEEDDVTLEATACDGASPEVLAELRALDAMLAKQPDEYRSAWLLHRVEGWTLEETAAAMGRSLATAKRYVAAIDVVAESAARRCREEQQR